MRVLVVCALASCTYPDKVYDGPFTCLGAELPTTAEPLVHLAGLTIDPQTKLPVGGVTVSLQTAQLTTIFTTTSDTLTGTFTIPLNTNGTPVSGIDLYTSAPGKVDAYYFPSRPIAHDLQLALSILSPDEASALAADAGISALPGNGAVLLSLNDCLGAQISGGTLASSPPGTVRYFNNIQPSMTATMTDAGGVAMVAGLQPGTVTLNAKVGEMTLPPLTVKTVANAFTITEIQP